MRSNLLVATAAIALATSQFGGCGCRGGKIARPYADPGAEALVSHLRGLRDRVSSFRSESVMDYWLGSERIKSTVLLMGRWDRFLRFNALNPTGDNVAADLACDGQDFAFLDLNQNCYLRGPCSADAIAQLLRISLAPDDFVYLAVGGTPLLPAATASSRWDADGGYEILELASADGAYRQTVVLDGADQRWDVRESTVRDAAGKVMWKLQNKDFRAVKTVDGTTMRLPGKTRFEQPPLDADLIVDWKKQELNVDLTAPALFEVGIADGIPVCP